MPRQAGLDAPGTLHQVTLRGIEKRLIVTEAEDREESVGRMGAAAGDTGTASVRGLQGPGRVGGETPPSRGACGGVGPRTTPTALGGGSSDRKILSPRDSAARVLIGGTAGGPHGTTAMERGGSHQGRGTPAEQAQRRRREVSTSQGGLSLDTDITAGSNLDTGRDYTCGSGPRHSTVSFWVSAPYAKASSPLGQGRVPVRLSEDGPPDLPFKIKRLGSPLSPILLGGRTCAPWHSVGKQ